MRGVLFASMCLCAGTLMLPGQSPLARATPQRPSGDPKTGAAATTDRLTVFVYDSERSRAIFGACDADGDDRLDLFEGRAALADLGDPRSPAWFRRLDADRDGFLDWPEFDRFYREHVRSGGTLHLQLVRPLPELQATPTSTTNAAPRRTIDLFDADHDGQLDFVETEAMLAGLGLPPSLASMAPSLDRNHDGKLGPDELAPAMQQFQIDLFAPIAPAADKKPATALGEPWLSADADRNQSIDKAELAAALRRIDPQLERWTDKVLAAADRNGNGRLEPAELPAVEAQTQAMAERSTKR